MIAASAKFRDHLRASHQREVRAGVWMPDATGAYVFQGYVGVSGGTLTIDGTRNILRQSNSLTVTSLETLLAGESGQEAARNYLESLTSNSAELALEWGLRYPNGQYEWVQIARLRVEESKLEAKNGALQITSAYDAGTRVNDFNLVTVYAPYTMAGVKMTYLAAIRDLVDTSYPSAHPPLWDVHPGVDAASLPPDGLSFTGSRWDAVASLAAAINASVWPDQNGTWVVKPKTQGRTPVWDVNSGVDGVMVQESTIFSRRDQFNAVAVRWQNAKNVGGLVYIVDADPDSPTYYDGPFGRKPRPEETVDTITTEAQAIEYARSLLEQYKGKTRGIDLGLLHNPLLEPGDVVAVYLTDGSAERHIIDSISLPLVGGTMTLQTRILRGGISYDQSGVTYNDVRYTYEGLEVSP